MCWNYVSETLGKQYVMKHYEMYGQLIQETLDDCYNELCDLVKTLYMYIS